MASAFRCRPPIRSRSTSATFWASTASRSSGPTRRSRSRSRSNFLLPRLSARAADRGLDRGEQRHEVLLVVAHGIALRVMGPHVGERRRSARQRVRNGRGETVLRIAQGIAKAPFLRIGLFEPPVGGAAFATRRMPGGLLDVCEFGNEGVERRVGAPMRLDGGEDRIGLGENGRSLYPE